MSSKFQVTRQYAIDHPIQILLRNNLLYHCQNLIRKALRHFVQKVRWSFHGHEIDHLLNKMAEGLPYKVLTMIKEVVAEQNLDRMINRILSSSLEFTDMERAVLILAEDPPTNF